MRVRDGYYSEKIRDLAFAEAIDKLGRKQEEVYRIIQNYGPICTEKVASILRVFPHTITPRVKELREMDLVYFWGEGKSETSGKAVSLWKAKEVDEQMELGL